MGAGGHTNERAVYARCAPAPSRLRPTTPELSFRVVPDLAASSVILVRARIRVKVRVRVRVRVPRLWPRVSQAFLYLSIYLGLGLGLGLRLDLAVGSVVRDLGELIELGVHEDLVRVKARARVGAVRGRGRGRGRGWGRGRGRVRGRVRVSHEDQHARHPLLALGPRLWHRLGRPPG